MSVLAASPAEAQEAAPESILEQLRQARPQDGLDRFRLYTACRPLGFAVYLEDEATQALAYRIVEERLRSIELLVEARPQSPDRNMFLADERLIVSYGSGRLELSFMKPVVDVASGERHVVETTSFSRSVTDGTTGSLATLSEVLDLFLSEYLRVNQDAC